MRPSHGAHGRSYRGMRRRCSQAKTENVAQQVCTMVRVPSAQNKTPSAKRRAQIGTRTLRLDSRQAAYSLLSQTSGCSRKLTDAHASGFAPNWYASQLLLAKPMQFPWNCEGFGRQLVQQKERHHPMGGVFLFGAPEGTRTPDLLIRSQALYPAELRAHIAVRQRIRLYHLLRICQ